MNKRESKKMKIKEGKILLPAPLNIKFPSYFHTPLSHFKENGYRFSDDLFDGVLNFGQGIFGNGKMLGRKVGENDIVPTDLNREGDVINIEFE